MKLLLVYSSKDPKCIEVFKRIRGIEQIKSITTPVDASNPTVNTIIKNSKNITLKELPAIFTYGDDKISKFEGLKKVNEYISHIEENIRNQPVGDESDDVEDETEDTGAEETYKSTKISDLGFTDDEPVKETYTPVARNIDQGPPRPDIKNMPIKNKRTAGQNKKIDEFVHQRSNVNNPPAPSRIQITSPKMEQPQPRRK